MNNTISVYELLGLIKDGKAPKKIKYEDIIWKYDMQENEYTKEKEDYWLFQDYFPNNLNLLDCLEDKLEILEEDKSIIEKLKLRNKDITFGLMNEWLNFTPNQNEQKICSAIESIGIKINEIIDYINKKEVDKR